MKQTNIVEAIRNPRLFKPLFGDLSSWFGWLVWLKAVFGIGMDQRELELYRQCTGRSTPPSGGSKEAYAIVGRRGGKSRIVAFAGVFIGCFHDFSKYLSVGERGMVLILARDRDQARVVFNYIRGILETVPVLKQMVLAWKADELELNNNVTIAVKTSDYRTIRGVTLVCCVCDEVGFWDSQGVNPDREIFKALRPAMVTIPSAKLLVISSPYSKAGVLFEAHRQHYGRENSPVLVWQAPTVTMNGNITEEFVRAEMEADPEAARSEWLAQFREDIEAAFSLESIEDCVVRGRMELPPAANIQYTAFVDPSGGRRDQFAVAVAHRNGEKVILDMVHAWRPPFDPSVVIKECAEMLKLYRIQRVTGDQYAAEFVPADFRKHGIDYKPASLTRSELYLSMIPIVCCKRVELLDNRKLVDEFRRLERRRGRSGKDTVDHPVLGSDDLANAVSGAVSLLSVTLRIDTKQIILCGERRTATYGRDFINLPTPGERDRW